MPEPQSRKPNKRWWIFRWRVLRIVVRTCRMASKTRPSPEAIEALMRSCPQPFTRSEAEEMLEAVEPLLRQQVLDEVREAFEGVAEEFDRGHAGGLLAGSGGRKALQHAAKSLGVSSPSLPPTHPRPKEVARMSEPIWVCEKGHVDDHHVTDGGACPTCAGEGMVVRDGEDQLRPDSPTCPACKGDGRATNVLCSRCGGTCTPFASVELLAREYIERLRVNVGLLAENTQLKKKLREGGDDVGRRQAASDVMARRGAGESGSPPELQTLADEIWQVAKELGPGDLATRLKEINQRLWYQAEPRYTLSELTDLLTSDEVVEVAARGIAVEGDSVFAWEQMPKAHNRSERKAEKLRADTREHCRILSRAALQGAIASIKGEGGS